MKNHVYGYLNIIRDLVDPSNLIIKMHKFISCFGFKTFFSDNLIIYAEELLFRLEVWLFFVFKNWFILKVSEWFALENKISRRQLKGIRQNLFSTSNSFRFFLRTCCNQYYKLKKLQANSRNAFLRRTRLLQQLLILTTQHFYHDLLR